MLCTNGMLRRNTSMSMHEKLRIITPIFLIRCLICNFVTIFTLFVVDEVYAELSGELDARNAAFSYRASFFGLGAGSDGLYSVFSTNEMPLSRR